MKISDGFVVQKIGESFYAVPVTKNSAVGSGMVKLNETAHFIWKKLEEGLDFVRISEELSKEYNVDKETALGDVKSFAERLGKVGILEGNDET
jgi:hypothetical protein